MAHHLRNFQDYLRDPLSIQLFPEHAELSLEVLHVLQQLVPASLALALVHLGGVVRVGLLVARVPPVLPAGVGAVRLRAGDVAVAHLAAPGASAAVVVRLQLHRGHLLGRFSFTFGKQTSEAVFWG